MTKAELIERLKELALEGPGESSHIEADALLLEYINDPEVSAAFNALEKWYA